MTKASWQEHFKNTLEGAHQAFSAEPSAEASGLGFLGYCLQENLISARDYLEWAKEAYQMPLLIDEYFMANSPLNQVYHSTKTVYAWTPFCLPLAVWDGVLLVACLEVPADFPTNIPAAFLLASPTHMAQTWHHYSQFEQEAGSHEFVAAIPGSSFTVSPLQTLSPSEESPALESRDLDSMASVPAAFDDAADPLSALNPLDALLNDSSSAPKNLFDANGELLLKDEEPVSSESNPVIEIEEQSEGLPEGLSSDAPAASPALASFSLGELTLKSNVDVSDTESTKTATAHFEMETKTITLEDPSRENAAPATAAVAKSALTKGPRTVEPIGPIASKEDLAALENSGLHRAPPIPTPTAAPSAPPPMPKAPVKSTTSHGMAAAYLLEKIRKQHLEFFDKEVINSLRLMKPYFKKAMLLAIGDKDRVVKPLLWDENFGSQEAARNEFELKTPSAFRIVTTTQKPYHGFVTTNDLHDSFFESWNQGQIPDHITLVPFMDGDLVVGMILGIGEKSSYNRQVLQATEVIAKELATRIFKLSALPATSPSAQAASAQAAAGQPLKKSVA